MQGLGVRGCWDSGVFLAQVWDLFPITLGDSSTVVLCLLLAHTAGPAAVPVKCGNLLQGASRLRPDPDGSSDLQPTQSEISISGCLSTPSPPQTPGSDEELCLPGIAK